MARRAARPAQCRRTAGTQLRASCPDPRTEGMPVHRRSESTAYCAAGRASASPGLAVLHVGLFGGWCRSWCTQHDAAWPAAVMKLVETSARIDRGRERTGVRRVVVRGTAHPITPKAWHL